MIYMIFYQFSGERLAVWENLGMKPSANQFAELGILIKFDERIKIHYSVRFDFKSLKRISKNHHEHMTCG